MIIESRKTELQHEITREQWNEMVKDRRSRKYRVISELPKKISKGMIYIPDIVKEIKKDKKKITEIKKHGRKKPIKKAPKDNVKSKG